MYTNKLCITISQNENTILYQIKSRFQFPPQGFLLLRNHYYSILEWLFWLTGKINDFGVAVFFTSCAWPHFFWGKPANRINDRVFLFLPWPEKPADMVTNRIHFCLLWGLNKAKKGCNLTAVRCCSILIFHKGAFKTFLTGKEKAKWRNCDSVKKLCVGH